MKEILTLVIFINFLANGSILEKSNNEKYFNTEYSKKINGQIEVKKFYILPNTKNERFVIIDIETETEVIEAGLDKRSSLDSIQQVLFFAHLTGKKPVVVIYDTDNKEDIFEYRIKIACQKAKIEFRNIRL